MKNSKSNNIRNLILIFVSLYFFSVFGVFTGQFLSTTFQKNLTTKVVENSTNSEKEVMGIATAQVTESPTQSQSPTQTTTVAPSSSPTVTQSTTTPTSIATSVPTKIITAIPTQSIGFVCNCSKTCTQITTCAEAQYQLNSCGCSVRDKDKDGIACDDEPLKCQN
jgi:cytoskeletal protein RodZ